MYNNSIPVQTISYSWWFFMMSTLEVRLCQPVPPNYWLHQDIQQLLRSLASGRSRGCFVLSETGISGSKRDSSICSRQSAHRAVRLARSGKASYGLNLFKCLRQGILHIQKWSSGDWWFWAGLKVIRFGSFVWSAVQHESLLTACNIFVVVFRRRILLSCEKRGTRKSDDGREIFLPISTLVGYEFL